MNIQLANRIHLVPVHDILLMVDDQVTLRSGKAWYEFFTENDLIFDEEEKSGSEFDIFNQSLNPVIIMDKSEMEQLLDRQLIVKLFTTGGNSFIWGSLNNGVHFTFSTHTDRYTLNLTRQSPDPVF